jgi:multicomponent Na+:H+ antiporter subunit G
VIVLSDILLGVGVFFALLGSIGIIRLPDYYTRAHAAAKPDTLGLILLMLGLALREGVSASAAKLLLIGFFVGLASPAASHALGRSAVRMGLAPWMRNAEKSDD